MSGGVWKKFQMTNFTMPNNLFFLKNALILVPGVADVGVPHGDGHGAVAQARGFRSKIYRHHVDQREKLKE